MQNNNNTMVIGGTGQSTTLINIVKKPNPNYIEQKDVDCTNFASQVLYTGGIPKDNIWKPYSDAWFNVDKFYDYLINHKLAKECQLTELRLGDFIQYRNPNSNKNDFHHTAIVVKGG
ncbi:12982_t:CDS:2 [Cetraspora pellucida]|uniref:12982_t:CDS:1 n=1 Tax=Cetraspora pellucida TaxID=1433469 RepID=A0ACA9LUK6_9GLOM|nr:12982_t:CDS:2 [Cetraspora pellucida]